MSVCGSQSVLPTVYAPTEYGTQVCLESCISCYDAVKHSVTVICVTSA